MKNALVGFFSFTLVLNAFLLFSIQPLFGKMILPLLGGAPAVWNTAMLFFQLLLLAGYAYAHLSTRFLPLRAQAWLHIGLLILFSLALPIALPEGWTPPTDSENPVFWQLAVMFVSVGGPFFILSGAAPLLQHWFSRTTHENANNPYFLYAASNIGSMAALLLYPALIEPLLGVKAQSLSWMALYLSLLALVTASIVMARRPGVLAAPNIALPASDKNSRPSARLRLTWLLLAFIPSSLMLGVTTYITTDIAAAPLFWILPLALYLGTFIIAFSERMKPNLKFLFILQALGLSIVCAGFIDSLFAIKVYQLVLHLAVFFLCALAAHITLAEKKPAARHLTEFYLIMSLGGVLGGAFNALAAPVLFAQPVEYPLMLAASAFIPLIAGAGMGALSRAALRPALPALGLATLAAFSTFLSLLAPQIPFIVYALAVTLSLLLLIGQAGAFAIGVLIVLCINPGFSWPQIGKTLYQERNFFGISRIVNSDGGGMRLYMHGTTIHGTQALDDAYRLTPLSYYYKDGAGADPFKILSQTVNGPHKVAVLGLGAGSVACFTAPGRSFDFYEIDPAVARIAENQTLFTFLTDCGSPYRIIMGDGRLKLADAPDYSYDLIFLDVFSSDNIPIHFMTKEVFALYKNKLRPGGILMMNISNRYLNLIPLVHTLGTQQGLSALFRYSQGKKIAEPDISSTSAVFAILTANPDTQTLIARDYPEWKSYTGELIKPWTDDYANIVGRLWFGLSRFKLD